MYSVYTLIRHTHTHSMCQGQTCSQLHVYSVYQVHTCVQCVCKSVYEGQSVCKSRCTLRPDITRVKTFVRQYGNCCVQCLIWGLCICTVCILESEICTVFILGLDVCTVFIRLVHCVFTRVRHFYIVYQNQTCV